MNYRTHLAAQALVIALAATGAVRAEERNAWPLWVGKMSEPRATGPIAESGVIAAWSALGPLWFDQPRPGSEGTGRQGGFRPLYVRSTDADGRTAEAFTLYPLLSYRASARGYRWSVLNLINRFTANDTPPPAGAPAPVEGSRPESAGFDLWPFYFSRQTGDAATSYRAVFPLRGTITQRFGQDRFSWALFPLYGRFEKKGVTTTTVPWPFIKIVRGDGHHGNELWPLYGHRAKPGVYRETFALWPLLYRNERTRENGGTDLAAGVLPFYALDRSEGYVSETYGWPFFGYVDRTSPYRYHATHYFWPLFVQGRGDQRHVNRWAPFYTHSVIKGTEKRWVLWPLWRRQRWQEAGLTHTKTQVLYFLYNSTQQQSVSNPALPIAEKVHLWPLLSAWDNGAGRRQFQMLSPFEVFFPHNEPVRRIYSPLFALWRHDTSPEGVRASLLWDAVSYRRAQATKDAEFHLGPLFASRTRPTGTRLSVLGGLFGIERASGQRVWRPFFGRFSRTSDSPAAPAATP